MDILETCLRCAGTGNEPGGTPIGSQVCISCNGSGKIARETIDLDEILADIIDKLDTQDTKLDLLDTHLDTIEAKIDALP